MSQLGSRVAACVTVIRSPGEVLLVRRMAHQTAGGQWAVPGGKLEKGDLTVAAAAQRELYEETGLRARVENNPFFVHPIGRSYVLHHFWAVDVYNLFSDARASNDAEQLAWIPLETVLADRSDKFVPMLNAVLTAALDRLKRGKCRYPTERAVGM